MYAIPVDELQLDKIEWYRGECQKAILRKAQELKIATSLAGLRFTEAQPLTHLGQPAGAGYTNEVYITGAIAANTWTSVFDTAVVPTVPNRVIVGFYKIADWTVPCLITAVRFRLGATGATTKGWVHLEQFFNVKLAPEVYLSEPVIYGPQDEPFIECYARAAIAVGERLGFGCFIAEPAGGNVS